MARYRIFMSVEVESKHDEQAYTDAVKLEDLLKSPMVKMAVEGAGIRLVDDGRPVVHAPIRQ